MRGIGAEFAGQCPLGATHRCCRCERALCCDRHRLICPYCVNGYCPECLPIHPCLRRVSVASPSVQQARVGSASGADRAADTETVGGIEHKVGHIVEDPAGIARLIDVEVPTEYYYDKFREDLESRHPRASKEIIEHMVSLAVFLDPSILSGCSFGSAKASIAVTTGKVLGRIVSRTGATCEPERVNAIVDFAPLENPNHIRQFLGCTNWIRWFLPAAYPTAAKTLTEYLKPGKEIQKGGFGQKDGKHEGDKASHRKCRS